MHIFAQADGAQFVAAFALPEDRFELKETRWIIAVMIEHDLYHAREINHIQSLRHHTDRWQYNQE